jgi:hypothetical protein
MKEHTQVTPPLSVGNPDYLSDSAYGHWTFFIAHRRRNAPLLDGLSPTLSLPG